LESETQQKSDALLAAKREHDAKIKEKRREYYEKNRYRICNHTLNSYCLKAMEKIRVSHPEAVDSYIQQYPFEEYAEKYIRRVLYIHKISRSHGMHDDCYDAGMMAYLYSIHRCACMQYTHTQAYIKKMIRIYVVCAIVIYHESRNICRTNGFSEIRLDKEGFHNLY